jgi:hypothetical protein
MRLKPIAARLRSRSGEAVRGSTSIETSALGVSLKARCSEAISSASSASSRKVGEPPPKCSLRNSLPTPQLGHVQIDLLVQQRQVVAPATVVLGDDLVAGAVVADRFAKRDVHVKRKRQ